MIHIPSGKNFSLLHFAVGGLLLICWLAMTLSAGAPATAESKTQPENLSATPSFSNPAKLTGPSKLTQPPQSPQAPAKPVDIELMAVGDIMMHGMQIKAGKLANSNRYDFASFFKFVAPTLQRADLAIGNLETTLAGEAARFTGYPMFNAPDELAFALKNAHFDVITTANNHTLDRGEKGLLRTIDQLKKHRFYHTGSFRSQKERDEPLIIDVKSIKIAILAYTYGTNGIPIPKGKPYLINLLDQRLMAADIQKARAKGADVVAVFPHFGPEYWRKPSDDQKRTVDFLFRAGADLIFGSHTHVVQPYEVRTLTDANGRQRKGVVIYSLGNFIANQMEHPRNIGGILSVRLQKANNKVTIGKTTFIPTYVHRFNSGGKPVFNVLPMAEILQKRNYSPFNAADYQRFEQRYLEITRHVISKP